MSEAPNIATIVLPISATYRGKSRVGQYSVVGCGPAAIVTAKYRLSEKSRPQGCLSPQQTARLLLSDIIRNCTY
ncbi:hypothetical protein LGH83_10850 [Lichenihabitans sp. PAMC28606]|uniref:hypothetical protein n=1 Tax=Lichenihabitans sp. PAMC28606 TaxID=2880932 RepID=UPI001D0BC81F|nr:hypothetical protein [Lichenihabitans sp. PAMC28606]UDL93125.1 hypothetical protein LGH83_10850 [Lichenihabitans sp. PAMC28606]